jgi:hypothetical protein
MSRDITAGLNTEFTSSSFKIAFFFKSVWSSGTTYIWTGYEDISWDGQTWQGVGNLMGIPSVSETKEVQANGAAFSLSGVPSALISLILTDARQGNEVSLWVAAIDSSGSIVADPYKLFSGLMDVPGIQEGGDTSIISLQAENRLIELERPKEIRYTDRFQQDRFSGDLGLQYVASLQNKAINWGQTN